MNAICPECGSIFRVDPAKIPLGGVRARCSVCGGVIAIGDASAFGGVVAAAMSGFGTGVGTPARGATAPMPAAPRYSGSSVPMAATPGAPAMPQREAPAFGARPAAGAPRPTAPAMPGYGALPAMPAPATGYGALPAMPAPAAPMPAPPRPVPPRPVPPRPMTPPPATPAPAITPVSPPMRMSAPLAAPPAREPPAPFAVPSGAPRATVPTARPSSVTGTRPPINPFLANDPNQKAKRLARALVSDIVAYFPEKHQEGVQNGSLRELFREEIKKSYEEYVEQMGKDFADSTTHFQDALNDVLAQGQRIF